METAQITVKRRSLNQYPQIQMVTLLPDNTAPNPITFNFDDGDLVPLYALYAPLGTPGLLLILKPRNKPATSQAHFLFHLISTLPLIFMCMQIA